jgi:hypothetical protein
MVVIYDQEGKEHVVEPEVLDKYLESGYTVTDPSKIEEPKKKAK